MRFLIFGGTGFIGSQLRLLLENEGHEVEATSRSGANGTLALDISDPTSFEAISIRPDVIVNAASLIPKAGKTSSDPAFLEELFRTNVIGGVNICNWAVQHQVKKILNLSTLVVVQKPWPNPLRESTIALPVGPHAGYAMSKLSQEQLMNQAVSDSEVQLTHLRLSAVYGPTMIPSGILFFLLNGLKNGEELSLTNASKVEFDFIHVDDVAKMILVLSDEKIKKKILNVASGTPISLAKLAELMKKLMGSESIISHTVTDIPVSEASISTRLLNKYIQKWEVKSTSLEQGLRQLIETHSQ